MPLIEFRKDDACATWNGDDNVTILQPREAERCITLTQAEAKHLFKELQALDYVGTFDAKTATVR